MQLTNEINVKEKLINSAPNRLPNTIGCWQAGHCPILVAMMVPEVAENRKKIMNTTVANF